MKTSLRRHFLTSIDSLGIRHNCNVLFLMCFLAFSSSSARADLLSFCTSKPPDDPTIQAAFKSQCAAYLQAQFQSAASTAASNAGTTQLNQEQTQAAIYSSIAGMLKAPASQVAQGVSPSALTAPAQLWEAKLVLSASEEIGRSLQNQISDTNKVILVQTASQLLSLRTTKMQSTEVLQTISVYKSKLPDCTASDRAKPAVAPLAAAAAVGAIVSTAVTVANMFQPTLVATGTATGVADPGQLMIAGLLSGTGLNAKNVILSMPVIAPDNKVIAALEDLRSAMVSTATKAATCKTKSDGDKMNAAVTQAQQYVTSITQSAGTAPSLYDSAAIGSALTEQGITHVLLLQRDVSSIGVAAVKPNWLSSTKLYMGAADLISYQYVSLDDGTTKANVAYKQWNGTCSLDAWADENSPCGAKEHQIVDASKP